MTNKSNDTEQKGEDLALALFGAVPDHEHTVKELTDALQQVPDSSDGDYYVMKFQFEFLICSHEVMQYCDEAGEFGMTVSNSSSNDSSRVRGHAEMFNQAVKKYNEAHTMVKSMYINTENTDQFVSQQQIAVVQKILNLLSMKLSRCRVEFIAWANKVLASSLTVNDHIVEIIQNGSSLGDAYDVLGMLQQSCGSGDENRSGIVGSALERAVKTFTKDIYYSAITPILNINKGKPSVCEGSSLWVFSSASVESSGKKMHHRLEWKQKNSSDTNNDTTTLSKYSDILDNLSLVLKFVCEHALLSRNDLISIVSSQLFSTKDNKGNGLLLKNLLHLQHDIIPSKLSELPPILKSLPNLTLKFDEVLGSMRLLSSPGPLSTSICDIELKYAEKRRMDILAEGHLILMKDYHNTIKVGDTPARTSITDDLFDTSRDDPFIFSYCSVSSVAHELLLLARKTLEEAADNGVIKNYESQVQTPRLLYRTSRELFDLFRAVVFSRHGLSIETIPRCAAVTHNDCTYFAFNLLTLGLEFGPKFKSDVRKLCTFIDMVPIFRELAEEKFGEMVKSQKDKLKEIMETKIGGFWHSLALDGNSGSMVWCETETAVNGALYHIKQLEQAWRPILSADIYYKAMGNLVDTVFDILLEHIMKAPDISEAACPFVSSLFGTALFSAEQSFPKGESQAKISSRSWNKFFAVGKFMNFSLSDISQGLADGFFKDLTSREMSALVRSTFADGVKREKLLLALVDSD